MNWIDYLLLALVAVSGIRGLRLGAASQVLSFGGFCLGLFLGALVVPALVGSVKGNARSLIVMGVVFGAAFVFGAAGRLIGIRFSSVLKRVHLGTIDSVAGVAVAVASTLVAAWLVGSFVANSRFTTLDGAVDQSHILRAMDRSLPPVPSVFSRVESFLDSAGFPIVFAGLPPEAAPPVSLPTNLAVRAAVLKAERSTVQIVGAGCGVIQEGSGFVVAPGWWSPTPTSWPAYRAPCPRQRRTPHGHRGPVRSPARPGRPAGAGIDRSSSPDRPRHRRVGARRVWCSGFPAAGPFTDGSAGGGRLLRGHRARHLRKDPDAAGGVQIEAVVQPGNSGGPLIASGDAARDIPDGTVIGVVFARSTVNLTWDTHWPWPPSRPTSSHVHPSSGPVGTGACVSG